MYDQFIKFLIRWLFNSFGLWLAFRLLGTGYEDAIVQVGAYGFLLAGLVFSVVNAVLKPFLVILSLPAILLSLGLFMLIVNGVMVYISIKITPGFSMSFVNSIITGMLLSLINYIVSTTLLLRSEHYKRG